MNQEEGADARVQTLEVDSVRRNVGCRIWEAAIGGDASRPVDGVIRTSAVVGAKQRRTQQQLQRRMELSTAVADGLHKSEAINHLKPEAGYPTECVCRRVRALRAG